MDLTGARNLLIQRMSAEDYARIRTELEKTLNGDRPRRAHRDGRRRKA